MLAFTCPHCQAVVFFDSTSCLTCGTVLGYVPDGRAFTAVTGDGPALCVNRDVVTCNWLPDDGDGLCRCCSLTRTRPADTDPAGLAAWAAVEAAKRQLVFQLDDLALPVGGAPPLRFDLLSTTEQPVTTGHADGVVTLDLAEGADSHREKMRIDLAEPYRTVLGHLRHEVGHYYWQRLVDGTPALDGFRALFGDERVDYATALDQHYARTDDGSWTETHVSRYAAAHPWEDWAETFAHYLHMRDTLQTAAAWRISVAGPVARVPAASGFPELVATWMAFTLALNAVNRSMGKDDLYPFVLPDGVIDKLGFVHDVVTRHSGTSCD